MTACSYNSYKATSIIAVCCLTWKAQSATIKILAFMLMLAGWDSCTVLGVRNCCLLYRKIDIYLKNNHLCKHSISCFARPFNFKIFIYLFCTLNIMFQEQRNAVGCEVRFENITPTISIGCIVLLVTIWLLSARTELKSVHRFGTEQFLSFGTGFYIFYWFDLLKCI